MPRRTRWWQTTRPQHSKNRKRPRRWHRGGQEDFRYLKATRRIA
jgi:hypothetical protein